MKTHDPQREGPDVDVNVDSIACAKNCDAILDSETSFAAHFWNDFYTNDDFSRGVVPNRE